MVGAGLDIFKLYIAFFLEDSVDDFVAEMLKRKYTMDPVDSVNKTFISTSPGNMTTMFAGRVIQPEGDPKTLTQFMEDVREALLLINVKYHSIVIVDCGIFPTTTWAAGNIISAERLESFLPARPMN